MCLAFLLLFFNLAGAVPQNPAGSIAGSVTDPAGAAIPAAFVTIVRTDTGVSREMGTGVDGRFLFTLLPPGSYEITATHSGFAPITKKVMVSVNVTGAIELQMSIAATAENIDVVAETPIIDAADYSVKTQVPIEAIAALPLNGRKFLDLAIMAPGVTTIAADAYDPLKSGYSTISIAGQAGRTTRVLVDGAEINDEIAGATVQNFSPEIIQEFQVNTSSYDLSTAASSSGSVNISTRSGGNTYHGALYGYFRNDRLAAYPGLKRTVTGRVPFSRLQSGFSAGGPVRRNRAFWFLNFENNHQDQQTFITTGFGPGNPFDGPSRQPVRERTSTLRFDFRLNSRQTVFSRWSWNDNSLAAGFPTGSGIGAIPATCTMCTTNDTIKTNLANQIVAGWTWVVTPRFVNDVRVNVSTFGSRMTPLGSGPEIRMMDTNFKIGSNRISPQSEFQNRFQLREDISRHQGRHSWRAGLSWHRLDFFGSLQYWNPGDILLHSARDTGRNFPSSDADLLSWPVRYVRVGVGDPRIPVNAGGDRTRTHRYFGYLEDSFEILPRVTLTFGLNYRFDTNLVNYDMPKPAILRNVFQGDLSPTARDVNNAGGRFGVAWNPSGRAHTVVRGGWGIYYDTALDTLRHFERSHLGPAGSGYLLFNVFQIRYPAFPGDGDNFFNIADNYTLQDALRDLNGLRAALTPRQDSSRTNVDVNKTAALVDRRIEMPTAHHFNGGLQQKLRWDIVLTSDFTYRRTVNEYVILDANHFAANIGPVDRNLGPVTLFKTNGESTYRGVEVKLERRFRENFGWSVSYVASRFMASNGDGLGIGEFAYNNLNIRDSYGPNAQDRTHRLTLTGIWAYKGWQFSSITSLTSGPPLSVFVNGVSLTGSDPSQPNLLEGLAYNRLNRAIHSVGQLNDLISRWNQTRAGMPDAFNRVMPALASLPDRSIRFGDSHASTDIRIGRTFPATEKTRLHVIGEVFNLFNVANLTGYNTNPALLTVNQCGSVCSNDQVERLGFLQPTGRTPSIFGYGGPRAIQIALRLSF